MHIMKIHAFTKLFVNVGLRLLARAPEAGGGGAEGGSCPTKEILGGGAKRVFDPPNRQKLIN